MTSSAQHAQLMAVLLCASLVVENQCVGTPKTLGDHPAVVTSMCPSSVGTTCESALCSIGCHTYLPQNTSTVLMCHKRLRF